MPDNQDLVTPSLNLAIGSIGVKLACNNVGVVDALTERYWDFRSEASLQLHAEVKVRAAKRRGSLLDSRIVFEHRVLRLAAPGYHGFIDPDEGRAELDLSSTQPVEEIEYFLRIIFAILAFENNGLLFHAAGIHKGDQAYLFFGHSGAGKTTVARVSKRYIVLNDDLLLLLPRDGAGLDQTEWMAFATPFWNPTQVKPTAQGAPIVGLYRLVQDKRVFVKPMSKAQSLAEIVSNVPVIPEDPGRNKALIARGLDLLNCVPAYRLHFLPDDSFWKVLA